MIAFSFVFDWEKHKKVSSLDSGLLLVVEGDINHVALLLWWENLFQFWWSCFTVWCFVASCFCLSNKKKRKKRDWDHPMDNIKVSFLETELTRCASKPNWQLPLSVLGVGYTKPLFRNICQKRVLFKGESYVRNITVTWFQVRVQEIFLFVNLGLLFQSVHQQTWLSFSPSFPKLVSCVWHCVPEA